MSIQALEAMDLSAASQPDPTADPRDLLEGWYRYQRHEFLRKLRDLTPEQMASWSIPNSRARRE